jgi:hypothetical protein
MITINRRRIVMWRAVVDAMTNFSGTRIVSIGEERRDSDINTSTNIVSRGPDCV